MDSSPEEDIEGKENLSPSLRQTNEAAKKGCCGYWSCLCVLTSIPWIALVIGIVAIVGLILWSVEGEKAINYTQDILDTVSGNKEGFLALVNAFVATITVTAVVLICVISVVFIFVFVRFDMEARRKGIYGRGECHPWCHTFFHVMYGILIAVLFILVAWFVVMIAIHVTWLVASMVIEAGAQASQQLITVGIQQAQEIQYHAEQLVDDVLLVAQQIVNLLDNINAKETIQQYANELVNGTEQEQLQKAVQNIQSYNVSEEVTSVCPANVCLDLTQYEFLGSNACICNPEEIEYIKNSASNCVDKLIPAIVGLALLYLSGTLMLMKLMADRTHLVRDARVAQQKKKQIGASKKQQFMQVNDVEVM